MQTLKSGIFSRVILFKFDINYFTSHEEVVLRIIVAVTLFVVSACSVITGEDEKSSDAKNRIEELVITDISPGSGAEAMNGKRVHVHYTGWLYDALAGDKKGTKFDSSHDRGKPFVFTLGAKQVIAGWDQGVSGMKAGGKRQLIIPARLGYGRRGAGRLIPPGATLMFDVELLKVD